MANDCASEDMIAIVEMMVIVVRVSKVSTGIPGNVACRRHDTTPSSCQSQG